MIPLVRIRWFRFQFMNLQIWGRSLKFLEILIKIVCLRQPWLNSYALRTSFSLRDEAGTRILTAEKNLFYYEPVTFIHFMTAISSSLLGCFLFCVPSTGQEL